MWEGSISLSFKVMIRLLNCAIHMLRSSQNSDNPSIKQYILPSDGTKKMSVLRKLHLASINSTDVDISLGIGNDWVSLTEGNGWSV